MQRTYDWLHGRIPVGRGPCSALCRSLLRAPACTAMAAYFPANAPLSSGRKQRC